MTWHPSVTGKIVVDDPKKPGKTITAAYLTVKSLHRVIQHTVRLQAEGGILEWPACVPSSEVWVMLCEDKGGESDKLLLVFVNVRNSNSVYHTVLVGMLDKLKEKGIAIRVASPKLVMEEAPESYKDVVQVVETCHAAGISKKAIKLRPIAVIKG